MFIQLVGYDQKPVERYRQEVFDRIDLRLVEQAMQSHDEAWYEQERARAIAWINQEPQTADWFSAITHFDPFQYSKIAERFFAGDAAPFDEERAIAKEQACKRAGINAIERAFRQQRLEGVHARAIWQELRIAVAQMKQPSIEGIIQLIQEKQERVAYERAQFDRIVQQAGPDMVFELSVLVNGVPEWHDGYHVPGSGRAKGGKSLSFSSARWSSGGADTDPWDVPSSADSSQQQLPQERDAAIVWAAQYVSEREQAIATIEQMVSDILQKIS